MNVVFRQSSLANSRHLLAAALLFAASLPFLVVGMYVPLEWGDEGYFINGALRVLSGEVMYRDFQHHFPPGRVYTLALLLGIFGHDLAVVKVFWSVCHAAAVGVAFLVAARWMPAPVAVLASLAVLFNAAPQNKAPELLLSAGVLLVLIRVVEARTSDFVAGIWLAGVGFYRHDVAAFGVMLYAAALVLQAHLESGEGPADTHRVLERLRRAWPFALGLVLVLAPLGIYLAFERALATAVYELVFTGFVANQLMSLPFPPLPIAWSVTESFRAIASPNILYYIPVIVYATSGAVALRWLWTGHRRPVACQVLLAAGLGTLLFTQVLPRTDLQHLGKAYLPAHLLSFFLLATALAQLRRALQVRSRLRTLALSALALVSVAMPLRQFWFDSARGPLRAAVSRLGGDLVRVELPHGRLDLDPQLARIYQPLFARLAQHADATPSEYLLAYPSGASLNFLFGYRNPVPYDLLRVGELRSNDPEILMEILERVETTRPRVLVQLPGNPPVVRMFNEYAVRNGYRSHGTRGFQVFIRNDEG